MSMSLPLSSRSPGRPKDDLAPTGGGSGDSPEPGAQRTGPRAGFAKLGLLLALVALGAVGCATDPKAVSFQEGERLIREGQAEAGLRQLEQAVRDDPDNLEYRAVLARNREAYVSRLLAQGDGAQRDGRLEEAEARYRDVLRLHPENPRAPAGLAAVESARKNQAWLKEARTALGKGEYEGALAKLRGILAQAPEHAEAKALLKEVEEKAGRSGGAEFPQLAATFRRPVTLEFRETPLRSVFDALSRQSGLNFVFDKDVRTDQKATVFARDTAIADALDMILATSQLARKVLNANTLIIYPNIPVKQKEYQDLVVKSFFLGNADVKQTLVMIKTIAKIRDVHVDERLNMLMVRDTPESVRLVEKLVQLADRPEPEVMLAVEIMEVKRAKLQELGVQWPTQFTVLPPEETTQTTTDGGVATNTRRTGVLTLAGLKSLSSDDIGVFPNPTVTLRADDGDFSILANPRIRVKNKEKAKVHVGDKVPVITSNTTATGVVSESVSYLDVGLKLDVEPQVQLEGDVSIKVSMEVSNIVREVRNGTGTLTYQLGTRNAATVLRLKDGETQVLAGLIADEDRSGVSKVPGLGDLPLLGRLFSSHRDEKNKTEIVLLITPRVLRNVERPQLQDGEFFSGTDSRTSDQPLRLRSMASPLRPRQGSEPAETPGLPGAIQSDALVPEPVEPSSSPQNRLNPSPPRERGILGKRPGGTTIEQPLEESFEPAD